LTFGEKAIIVQVPALWGMDSEFVERVREELKASADEKTKQSFQRFFKERINYHGAKTATVGKIAKKYLSEIKDFEKKQIFASCEELLSSDFTEEVFLVSFWLPNLLDKLEPSDLTTFKTWIAKYINNWAKCDGFCNHTIGDLLQKYPKSIIEVKSWAKSSNRWLKRAAAVSLIVPAKKGKFLQDALEISNMLIDDKDDMVQKGYGWLLKEESRLHQDKVYAYVLKNRKTMPRTALRYAIELMPKALKSEAMKKN
jgi:3-methyladenine DNA glycosylase AlkD